jgi:DNA-binding Lrp family transcriptional regulator
VTAGLSEIEARVLARLQEGLPIVPRPYAHVAAELGTSEVEVLAVIAALDDRGVFKRFGAVVRHRPLGFSANAMVVWDAPDDVAPALGRRLAACDGVTLCYRRERARPRWPYNLYCMVHGQDREQVLERIAAITREAGLTALPRRILFSRAEFKVQGGRHVEAGERRAV